MIRIKGQRGKGRKRSGLSRGLSTVEANKEKRKRGGQKNKERDDDDSGC